MCSSDLVDGVCFSFGGTTSKAKEIPCHQCPQLFPTQLAMLEHCMADHILPFPKGKPIAENQCPWCLKFYSSRYEVLKHYGRKHCGHDRKEFKCATCGREFQEKGTLTRHIKAVHEQQRPHPCQECGKSFSTATHVRLHTDRVHLKLKPFVCGWDGCTKAFATASDRTKHQKNNHNGEWNFRCHVCEEDEDSCVGFNQQRNLDNHMKRHHPKEWQQQQEAFLASHPYVCKVAKCGKRFEEEEETKRHERKIHGLE